MAVMLSHFPQLGQEAAPSGVRSWNTSPAGLPAGTTGGAGIEGMGIFLCACTALPVAMLVSFIHGAALNVDGHRVLADTYSLYKTDT